VTPEDLENIELFTRAANLGGSKIMKGDVLKSLSVLGLRLVSVCPDRPPAEAFRDLMAGTLQVPCVREGCGRPVVQRGADGRWVHLAPDGTTNRTCKSAAYDDPRPGDEDRREWLDWPRDRERSIAYPGWGYLEGL
jgi:hypothetical protein